MVNDLKLKSKIDESRVKDAWVEVMGPPIVKYTTKLSCAKSKLYVQVSSPALKHELNYSKEKIIQVLNEKLGEPVIREVVVF